MSAPQPESFLARAGPLVLARFVGAGLTVCIPLALARALCPADYGTYKQLFLIAQTLSFLLPFGMAQSLFFFLPRAEVRRPYVGHALLFLTAMGVLAGVVVHALGGVVASALNNPALAEHRLALAVYTGAFVGSCGLEASLTSRGRTRTSAVISLLSDVTRAALLVVPVRLGYGLHTMMTAVAAYAVARWVLAWVVCLRGERGPLFDPVLLRRQLLYAAPFGAAMLLAIPQLYAHQYAVSAAVTPELFALYAVGCFQLPLVDLLYTPTSEVLMVRLGELEREGKVHEGVNAFREATRRLSYVFLPLAAFLFTAAPEFITAAFGACYLGAVPLFRVSVLGIALAILPMDGVLRARGETRAIFLSYLLKAAVTVPLLWVGVQRFGMMGGIASWAIAELVGKAALLARIPRALSAGRAVPTLGSLLPWSSLARAAGGALAAALCVVVLRAAVPRSWEDLPGGSAWHMVPLALAGVLFGIGYLVVLRLSGVRPLVALAALRRRRGTSLQHPGA